MLNLHRFYYIPPLDHAVEHDLAGLAVEYGLRSIFATMEMAIVVALVAIIAFDYAAPLSHEILGLMVKNSVSMVLLWWLWLSMRPYVVLAAKFAVIYAVQSAHAVAVAIAVRQMDFCSKIRIKIYF